MNREQLLAEADKCRKVLEEASSSEIKTGLLIKLDAFLKNQRFISGESYSVYRTIHRESVCRKIRVRYDDESLSGLIKNIIKVTT